jgi:hypothetical protein
MLLIFATIKLDISSLFRKKFYKRNVDKSRKFIEFEVNWAAEDWYVAA